MSLPAKTRRGSRTIAHLRRPPAQHRFTVPDRRTLTFEPLEDRRMLAVITVDSLADNTNADGLITLREAILAANNDGIADAIEGTQAGSGEDTILFDASLDGESITLTMGELVIETSMTVDAGGLTNGLTIDASGNDLTPGVADGMGSRIFNADSTTILIFDDFETDSSGDYSIVDNDGQLDSFVEFNSFSKTGPDGSFGTLFMEVNETVGQIDSVTAFHNTPISATQGRLSVDMYLGVEGTSGTTEHAHVGIGGDGVTPNLIAPPGSPSDLAEGSGSYFAISGDGDTSDDDYLWFVEPMGQVATDDPSYLAGSGDNDALLYQQIFPDGAPQNQWITLEVLFQGSDIVYLLNDRPVIDGSLLAGGGGPFSGHVSLGYADLFSSIATPSSSQFVHYDNLLVESFEAIDVELIGLTLTGGDVGSEGGGAILANAGVDLIVQDSVITGNSVVAEGVVRSGGGGVRSVLGSLTMYDSVIESNTAIGADTTPEAQPRVGGAGVQVLNGDATIDRTTIRYNELSAVAGGVEGGGAYLANSFASGTFLITNSSIYGNQISGSDARGAGLCLLTNDGAQSVIQNSTISGNTADGGNSYGGGVLNAGGMLLIEHSTITGNEANLGGGIESEGITTIAHAIVANNTSGDVTGFGFQSFGYNLIGVDLSFPFPLEPTDLPLGTDPLLGPLADNGGPTRTHELMPGSPAINAGDPSFEAGVGSVPLLDQRGTPFSRVVGTRIDIGAYEVATIVITADFVGPDFGPPDGIVSGLDFLQWQRNLGITQAINADGDANFDMVVDALDLQIWRQQYGLGLTVPLAAPSSDAGQAEHVASARSSTTRLALIDAAMAFDLIDKSIEKNEPVLDWDPGSAESVSDHASVTGGLGLTSEADPDVPSVASDDRTASPSTDGPTEESFDMVFAEFV